MIILQEIDISALLKAQDFLEFAINNAQSKLEKAGAIQAFEFSYELAWKTMKRILSLKGLELASPREVFRMSAKEKLIDDIDAWFEFIRKRNLTTHTYEETIADEIFSALPLFSQKLNQFITTIKSL